MSRAAVRSDSCAFRFEMLFVWVLPARSTRDLIVFTFKSISSFPSYLRAARLTPPAFLGLPTKEVKCNKFLILLRPPLHYDAPLTELSFITYKCSSFDEEDSSDKLCEKCLNCMQILNQQFPSRHCSNALLIYHNFRTLQFADASLAGS